MNQYDNQLPIEDLPSGAQVSHYEIIKKIGCGAMGHVYLAKDIVLDRLAALKFLPDAAADSYEARQRLLREAQTASQLNHPNIMTIYSVEEFGDSIFIVMEYIAGMTLKELIESGNVTVPDAVDIAIQICHGLERAHQAGIIHRDLKPQNVIIGNDGRTRLCDFGLARPDNATELTRIGSTVGTIAYMSPEQIQGAKIDHRSDLFSLGIVLYELFTGQLPFKAEYEAAVIYNIVNRDPEPVDIVKPDMPKNLAPVIMRLLAKKPENRQQSAGEVAAKLVEYVAGNKSRSNYRTRIWKWSIVFMLALSAMATFAWVYHNHFSNSPLLVKPRIMLAVLPLENLGVPEYDFFTEGITDEIITNLAKINGLGVISRTSVYKYKNSTKSLRQIGNELGVDYALEGSVLWENSNDTNYVRISVQLIRIPDDTHLWAESYQRVVNRVFILQSEIAEKVSDALDLALLEPQKRDLHTTPTANLEAYQDYLRGNAFYNQGWDVFNITQAISMYEKAVELDSNFAMAYTMLSRAHSSMYWEYHDRTEARLMLARQAVDRALALQPNLSYAHLALGMYFYSIMQYDKALHEFIIARKGHPNDSDIARAIAGVQRRKGQFAEAVANYSLALEYDPRSHITAFDVGLTYGLMRNYQKADQYMDLAISLNPEWPVAYIYKAWLCIFSTGDIAGAKQVILFAENKTDLRQIDYYWWLNRIVEKDPRKALSNIILGSDTASYYLYKAEMYRINGDDFNNHIYSDSARIILESKLALRPDEARFHSQLGLALAGLDSCIRAVGEGKKAVDLMPVSHEALTALFIEVNLAETYAVCEKNREAINQIKFMLSKPGFVSVPYLELDPIWNSLRNDKQFMELLTDNK